MNCSEAAMKCCEFNDQPNTALRPGQKMVTGIFVIRRQRWPHLWEIEPLLERQCRG